MSKQFAAILVVCVGIFFGVLFTTKHKAGAPASNGTTNSNQTTNHVVTAPKSVVTLTEYGDFACPACGTYYPVVEQIREQYKDQLTFQFRNFPLVEIHQNALVGAKAAEAADKQGKFWEMYNKLYQNQQEWAGTNPNPQQYFDNYATQLGIDLQKFHADMKSDEINNLIQADRADAVRQKFSSTPTFLIDGKKINSPSSLDAFKQLIEGAIKAKQPEATPAG